MFRETDDNDTHYTGRDEHHTSQSMPDDFDRTLGALDNLPDGAQTRAVAKQIIRPFGLAGTEKYIVQTIRRRDSKGKAADTIFLEVVGRRPIRLVIPPEVADLIARQRQACTDQMRRKSAQRVAKERKDAGILPGFMKKKET